MQFEEQSPHLEKNRILLDYNANELRSVSRQLNTLSVDDIAHLKNEINEYYFKRGWGLKILARNVLGVTYTICRSICVHLNIEFRKGFDVSTDATREFRRAKAKDETTNKTGWASQTIERKTDKPTRGIQGYYFNVSINDYVWLRSSWEYVFAKFLNRIGANWKTEVSTFNLSNGCSYRPDFFIYDSEWNLKKIIEVKGYWDDKAYKLELLMNDSSSDVEFVLVRDIQQYVSSDTTLKKEIATWKEIRKSKEFKLNA